MGRGRRTEGELQRWRALRDSNLRRLAGVSAARARSRDPEPQRGIWDMARPKRFELPTFWFVVSSGRFGLSGAQLQTLGNSESVPRFSQLPATPSKQVVATLSATVGVAGFQPFGVVSPPASKGQVFQSSWRTCGHQQVALPSAPSNGSTRAVTFGGPTSVNYSLGRCI